MGRKAMEIYGIPMKHGEIVEKTYGNPRKNPRKSYEKLDTRTTSTRKSIEILRKNRDL